jgi:hypothetical protein
MLIAHLVLPYVYFRGAIAFRYPYLHSVAPPDDRQIGKGSQRGDSPRAPAA